VIAHIGGVPGEELMRKSAPAQHCSWRARGVGASATPAGTQGEEVMRKRRCPTVLADVVREREKADGQTRAPGALNCRS
jgi:hypothetical protein